MFIKNILAIALLGTSSATAFNGPSPNAIVQPNRHTGTALKMAGGTAPALKVGETKHKIYFRFKNLKN